VISSVAYCGFWMPRATDVEVDVLLVTAAATVT
jgi:hypothetical protein